MVSSLLYFLLCLQGQARPAPAISLRAQKNQHLNSATISWVVPELTYTEETYTVVYHSQGQLPGDSFTVVKGDSDIYRTNVSYSVDLIDLEIGQTYSYQIVSSNTFGLTTESVVETFDAGISNSF